MVLLCVYTIIVLYLPSLLPWYSCVCIIIVLYLPSLLPWYSCVCIQLLYFTYPVCFHGTLVCVYNYCTLPTWFASMVLLCVYTIIVLYLPSLLPWYSCVCIQLLYFTYPVCFHGTLVCVYSYCTLPTRFASIQLMASSVV